MPSTASLAASDSVSPHCGTQAQAGAWGLALSGPPVRDSEWLRIWLRLDSEAWLGAPERTPDTEPEDSAHSETSRSPPRVSVYFSVYTGSTLAGSGLRQWQLLL